MHGLNHLSQTNFLAFNLFKHKHTNLSFILLILVTLFLTACSNEPTLDRTISVPQTTATTTKEITSTDTAEEKLALAQALNAKSPRNAESLQAQQAEVSALLIEAGELFLQQKNYANALWLANEASAVHHKNPQNTYALLIIKARSLFALNYLKEAQQQLKLAKELVAYSHNNKDTIALTLTFDYYLVLSDILSAQNNEVSSVAAQLKSASLTPYLTDENIQAIWHKLELLTPWQLKQLVKNNPPLIDGWAQLLNYSHKFGANPDQFSRYLSLWLQKNPTHPATRIIESLHSKNLIATRPNALFNETSESEGNNINQENKANTQRIENIAILLPLSGSQHQAGLAVQQGILAAYDNNTERNVYFIDTNQVDWENLALEISDLKIDHIIGPLLKPNVEKFLGLSAQHLALQIPTLLLNLSSQYPLSPMQTALSMRPEDEAIQAAATLSQQDYHQPMILSHNDRVSKRIALAFSQQWENATGNTVDIVYFDQGKKMQASLKENLDVNASQNRIKQLNGRLIHKIKSESRNRRDIDMIYIIGNAAQTRLIKPYIDVNISPFADIIPVYASSKSHSSFNDKHNPGSSNDLQGLTFTQIPWLLNSQQQDKRLARMSDKLWPKRTDSLSRIFAMGFDSYHLLDKVSLMQQIPYIHHFGQTGVLTLNDDNIITRSLIWGQYKNNKVTEIGMD